MEKVKKIAVSVLIASVSFLTLIAVLSIWDVFDDDVLGKSLSTIGILAFASLIVVVAAKAIEHHKDQSILPPNNSQ